MLEANNFPIFFSEIQEQKDHKEINWLHCSMEEELVAERGSGLDPAYWSVYPVLFQGK